MKVDEARPVFTIQSQLSAHKYSSGAFLKRNEINMAFEQKARMEQKVAADLAQTLKKYGQASMETAQAIASGLQP